MTTRSLWASLLLVAGSYADWHHMFTSSFSTPHLYSLQFDDQTNRLVNIANITGNDGHPWLSFSYDKSTIYAGETDGFASYTIESPSSLVYRKSVSVRGACGARAKSNVDMSYVIAELRTPFTVYGAGGGTCGTAMSVETDLSLQGIIQNFTYRDNSQVNGLALDPENKFLYSADSVANGIWVHAINDQGRVNNAGFIGAPWPDSGPQHLIVHPNGKYLYAVFAKQNTVGVFAIQSGPEGQREPLKFTGVSYSLLPQGADNSRYAADEVLLSADANILYASTRYRQPVQQQPKQSQQPKQTQPKGGQQNNPWWGSGWGQGSRDDEDEDDRRRIVTRQQRPGTQPGYITAILLTAQWEEVDPVWNRHSGPGFPIRRLFQLATTTSGGLANSISPAPWSNDYFALADSEQGLIEIWKLDNLAYVNYTGPVAEGSLGKVNGGWINNAWAPTGILVTPEPVEEVEPAPSPTPTTAPKGPQPKQPQPKGPQPKQPQPKQPQPQPKQPQPKQPQPKQPQPKQPNNPWGTQQNPWANTPWGGQPQQQGPWNWGQGGSGGKQGGDPWTQVPKNGGGSTPWGGGDWGSWDEDDDERRRVVAPEAEPIKDTPALKSRLARFVKEKRQLQPVGGPPVTARVVATWRAPVGGGSPSRPSGGRPSDEWDEEDWDDRRRVAGGVAVKPWTGSKKRRDVANHDGQVETEIRAAAEGRSCCANAVWFD